MNISEEEKMNPCTEITKVGQPYHSNSFTLKGKGNSSKNYLRTVGIYKNYPRKTKMYSHFTMKKKILGFLRLHVQILSVRAHYSALCT